MQYIQKMHEAKQFLEQYYQNCTGDMKVFVKLLLKLLYKDHNYSMRISVGKKIKDSFVSYLSCNIKKFYCNASLSNGKFSVIIKDMSESILNTVTIFGLDAISNITIQCDEICETNVYRICFTYTDTLDYSITLTM